MSQDVNVLAMVKGEERYVFLYDDDSKAETLRTFGRYASNPELSFTWYDGAVLSQKMRQEDAKLSGASDFSSSGLEDDVKNKGKGPFSGGWKDKPGQGSKYDLGESW
jgi:hypothetical protein